jgi:hypothetical protein
MSNSALIMMLVTEVVVTVVTGYFFFKVLFSKPQSETDSFSENDNEGR